MSALSIVILLTLIPTLELRASIPAGILGVSLHTPLGMIQMTPLPAWIVISTAIITNSLLGIILYEIISILLRILERIPRLHAWYAWYETRLLAKTRNWRRVEWLLLAGFIGLPLPGSGVYSGSILARALILPRRDAYKAILLGTLIAGSLVSLLTLTGRVILA